MREPLRVLRVVGRMDRGGAETTIMNAYRLIERSKLQFDFIVHNEDNTAYKDEIIALGGRIYVMPRYNGLNHMRYVKAWNDFFREHKEYKLIHGHLMSTASIYLKIAKKHGLKTIAHSHAISFGYGFLAIIKRIMQKQIYRYADYMFACSVPAGKWFFGPGVTSQPNFKVVPNGIEVSKYSFNPLTRQEVQNEFKISNSKVLGHVGSYNKWKNHDFLISVFKKVNEDYPDTLMLLVGEGKLKKKIAQIIEKNGLADRVIMTGSRRDVNRLLQAMDVFIFPSHFEGFGNAVTEAQAAGLPCVVSDRVPYEVKITELVEFVSLDKGIGVWADKIIAKFDNSERKNMSEEITKAGYDIKPIAKWYETFYLENLKPSALIMGE